MTWKTIIAQSIISGENSFKIWSPSGTAGTIKKIRIYSSEEAGLLNSSFSPDGSLSVLSQPPAISNQQTTPLIREISEESAAEAEAAANAYTDANFVSSVLHTTDLADLQAQIDGNVTSWFYEGEPSLINLPASEWTTNETKNTHLGDLYYDSLTGSAFRFIVTDSIYSWVQLSDADIATALALAQTAQDTADSKRRVFVIIPTAPYDVGDLWDTGAIAGIKRCQTAKASGESYSADNWISIADITGDNTAANITGQGSLATQNAVDLNTTDVINKSLANLDATAAANLATALSNADTAISAISDMEADQQLSPAEKTAWRREWINLQDNYTTIIANAAAITVNTDAITTARNTLYTYLFTTAQIESAPTVSYTIISTALTDVTKTYYNAFIDLTQAIADQIASNVEIAAALDATEKANLIYSIDPEEALNINTTISGADEWTFSPEFITDGAMIYIEMNGSSNIDIALNDNILTQEILTTTDDYGSVNDSSVFGDESETTEYIDLALQTGEGLYDYGGI